MAFAARFAERLRRIAPPAAGRGGRDARPHGADGDGFPARSRGGFGIRGKFRDDPDFRAPAVDWDRTAREVLTLEWIDGIPLTDPERLGGFGFDPPALGRSVIQSFLRHAVRDGFFHADMHQGNLFVDASGRLIAVDFGIMGRLGLKERRFLAEILYGFIRRDYLRVAEVHFEAGYVPQPIASRISRRPSARSANRSIRAPPIKSLWPSC